MKTKDSLMNYNVRIVSSHNAKYFLMPDRMYSAREIHKDDAHTVFNLREPSLSKSVVKRILKAPLGKTIRTRPYYCVMNLTSAGLQLSIGCQVFGPMAVQGLKRWVGLPL